jgi:branched-chain amino acid transport system ATP-binding protein
MAAVACEEITYSFGTHTAVDHLNLRIEPGETFGLLGPNGAGKTTTLRVAAGLLRPSSGVVVIGGKEVSRKPPYRRAGLGVCLVPEGRGIFRSLTVRENLALQIPPWRRDGTIDAAVEAFPVLGQRLHQVAGSLSGGQQQMLALARAFLSVPKVVLLDEVSMGLAPVVVDQIFESLRALASTGVSLVLVEQYVNRALEMADVAYLMDRGSIVWTGPAGALDTDALAQAYLGHSGDVPV